MTSRGRLIKARGFTLIEIMIVVVVAAILVFSAMPDTESAQKKSAIELIVRFEADVAFAQGLSIARPDDPVVIRVDTTTDSYWLARKSDPTTPIEHPGTKEPYVVTAGNKRDVMYSGVKIKKVDFGNDNDLGFNFDGTIDQEWNAVFQVQSGESKYEAVISASTSSIVMNSAHSVINSNASANANANANANNNGNENTSGGLDGVTEEIEKALKKLGGI